MSDMTALALSPRIYKFEHLHRPITIFEKRLQNFKKIQEDQLGFQVWASGEILAHCIANENLLSQLDQFQNDDNISSNDEKDDDSTSSSSSPLFVLELGCGVGLPGLTTAATAIAKMLGVATTPVKVVLTDYTESLLEAALEGIIASGVADQCECKVLDWKRVMAAAASSSSSSSSSSSRAVENIRRNLFGQIDDDDHKKKNDNDSSCRIRYILSSDGVYSAESARNLAATAGILACPGYTEFVAMTGSKRDRKGVDIFQRELRLAGAKNITVTTLTGPTMFFDPDGMPLPESRGADINCFYLWRVEF